MSRWRYVSVLASSAVDRGFNSRSDQTIDQAIIIRSYIFSAQHASLRRKIKKLLARN